MTSQTDRSLTIYDVALAGAVAVVLSDGVFDVWDMVVGIILLLFIYAFVPPINNFEKLLERLAYSAVLALSGILIVGLAIDFGAKWVTVSYINGHNIYDNEVIMSKLVAISFGTFVKVDKDTSTSYTASAVGEYFPEGSQTFQNILSDIGGIIVWFFLNVYIVILRPFIVKITKMVINKLNIEPQTS